MSGHFLPLLLVVISIQPPPAISVNRSSPQTLFDFTTVISIDDILGTIRSDRADCQQIARLFLARIRLYNARLGAVTVLNYRGALADAKRLDSYRKRMKGRLFGRLHCVPTLIKDNMMVAGLPTTLGLRLFANSTARTDATAVWRLKSEGALIVGKANLTPFAFGLKSPDEASEIAGQCRNPFGMGGGPSSSSVYGSSCGNAVGQSAGLAVIGLTTDTAGSATWPAAVCGLVTVRPPPKLYNSDGVFPLLKNAGDTLAPMAATVSDTILLLDILSNSNASSPNVLSKSPTPTKPYRIGVIPDFLYGTINFARIDGTILQYTVDPEIQSAIVNFFARVHSAANVTMVNLTVTPNEFAQQIYQIQRAWTDAFACVPQWIDAFLNKHPFYVKQKYIQNFNDFLNLDGIPGHYKRFFDLFSTHKAHCLPSLRKLRKVRTSAKRYIQKQLLDPADVDVIAFPRPHRLSSNPTSPADSILMLDPAGAIGFPAMNLPIGFAEEKTMKNDRYSRGTPIGLNLMTRPRKFKVMLDIARIYENSKPREYDVSHLPPEFL